MAGRTLGDADGDDLELHRELSPEERLNAILEARGLTTEQAVEAMGQLLTENQATFPHMIETTVMVSTTPGGPEDQEFHNYVGPFGDRRAAEAWATKFYAGVERVSWRALKIVTAQHEERLREEVRRIVGND